MKRLASLGVLLLMCAGRLPAQSVPNFSGVWKLDVKATERSERPRQRVQPYEITIRQTAKEITVENLATRWGAQEVTYSLDGKERLVADDSLGEIENFARNIRSQAMWDGKVLTLRTTPFGERVTPTQRTEERGAITTVHIYRLDSKAGMMTLDTTNFRAVPPILLHGRPYSVDDPAEAWFIRGFTEVFRK